MEAESLYRCDRCGFTNVKPICHGPGSGEHGEGDHFTVYALERRATPTYVITKHVDGGWNIIDHSGDPPTLQGGDRLVPESYATQLEEALRGAEESAIRWRSRADRLEATRNEAIRQAEARATQLEEALRGNSEAGPQYP